MSPAHRSYLRRETIIGIVINSLFSAAFAFAIFGRSQSVELWGAGNLAFDFLPQTFMISLMSVLVPTLLTRKRIVSGDIPPVFPVRPNSSLLVRALAIPLAATLLFSAIAVALLMLVWSGPLSFSAVLALKVFYGALVSSVITSIAIRTALRDAVPDIE